MLKIGANLMGSAAWAGIVGVLLLALAGEGHAGQAVANARSCMGCNASQMMQSARQSLEFGVGYVYDPSAAVIRKYEIGGDPTCGVIAVPESTTPPPSNQNASASLPSTLKPSCGAFRSVRELYPVDGSVQTIFASVVDIYRNWPSLLTTAQEKIYLGRLPDDPDTGASFDLRAAAWEYPSGTFGRFMNVLQDIIKDYDSLARLDIGLAKLVYKVQIPSGSAAAGFSGTMPSDRLQLNWDRGTAAYIQICDTGGNCANFELVVANGNVSFNYVDITDAFANAYPQPGAQYPSEPRWVWRSAKTEAPTFADWLRSNGTPVNDGIGFGTCKFGAILACTWQEDRLAGCNVQCN